MLDVRSGSAAITSDRSGERKWLARRRLTLILLLLASHLPLHGLWRLFGRRSPWPRLFLRRAGVAAGVDTAIVGVPVSRNVLIVANHLSWLDILVLAGATGARFVAKDEVRGWPVLGFLAGLNRTVYVARSQRAEVQAQSEMLRSAVAEGQPVALFPEGGTGAGRALLPFRASLFSALFPPAEGVVVQPVAIDYGAETTTIVWGDVGVGVEAMRVMALPGRRRVTLRFLDPIGASEFGDRKALARTAQDRIASALGLPG